ncbi:MAG: hypothetical protein LBJ45_02460 [Holosporaceae bacterium]|jgi:hypothetical protein|nr:hypothetical protein [Holosporaceae bacterium]
MRVFLLLLLFSFCGISIIEFSFGSLDISSSAAKKVKKKHENYVHVDDSSSAAIKAKKKHKDYYDDDDEDDDEDDEDDEEKERINFYVDGLDGENNFFSERNRAKGGEDSRGESRKKSEKRGDEASSEKLITIKLDLGELLGKLAPNQQPPPMVNQAPTTQVTPINNMPNSLITPINNMPNSPSMPSVGISSFPAPPSSTGIPNLTSSFSMPSPTSTQNLNSLSAAPNHLANSNSPETFTQTTTTEVHSNQQTPNGEQNQYSQSGFGQNQFSNYGSNNAQYSQSSLGQNQYQQNYNNGGMQNLPYGQQSGFQSGQQNAFGTAGNNLQMMGSAGNNYQGGNFSSEKVIVQETTEETIRYLRQLGLIDESKLASLTLGDTRTGICVHCKANKTVHVIGGQDDWGICNICFERLKMNQMPSGDVFGAQGNAYNNGMHPMGYGGGVYGNGYVARERGAMEEIGAVLDGKESSIGGLVNAMNGGNGQNSYGNTFGAGVNNPNGNQMGMNSNGNMVPLGSLMGNAALNGYIRDANGQMIPAPLPGAGPAGNSTIASGGNPSGTTTTITTTTTKASGSQMVLNASGQLVPLSSLPPGSFGYTKDPVTGQLVTATTAAAPAVATSPVSATTAPSFAGVGTTGIASANATQPAQQMVLDAAGNLVPLGSLPSGIFGYIKNSLGAFVPAKTSEEALAAGKSAASSSGFFSSIANVAKSAISGLKNKVSSTPAETAATTPAATAAATPATTAAATPAATTPATTQPSQSTATTNDSGKITSTAKKSSKKKKKAAKSSTV